MFAIVVLGIALVGSQLSGAVDFAKDVAPILEKNCVGCHGNGAHVDLSSRQDMLAGKSLIPGDARASSLYTAVENGSMPPAGKLSASDLGVLKAWIGAGAVWPDGVALHSPVKAAGTPTNAEMETVRKIHDRIVGRPVSIMAATVTIPNSTVKYDLVPIAGGEFQMGSTSGAKDERPTHRVHVDGFSMQAHEVTWDEYRLFMFAKQADEVAHKDELVDGVSRPTRPYVEMSFGMGINGFPAISMTQHAANKYAEWLSSKTGEFYRLPTEAEWEYACRAGSAKSPPELGQYAWFSSNSGGKYAKVATKKPNAWGLYDMLGNVMEWTLDAYAQYPAGVATNPWVKASQPYPETVRGGSWNDAADKLTCWARVASDASWKQQDPQLPKSIWYLTDAQWLGFRLVRPARIPAAEEMYRYWNSGVEHDEQ